MTGGAQGLGEALQEIAAALQRIEPDQVHISLPSRPPAEPNVQLPDEASLRRAAAAFGARARVVPPASGAFDLSGYDNVAEAVLAILEVNVDAFSDCSGSSLYTIVNTDSLGPPH